jgi:hypothetical protein
MTILGRGTSSATQAARALQMRQARRQKKHGQMSVKRTQEPALTDQTKLFIPRAPHLVEEGEQLEPEVFKNEEKQSFLGLMPAFIKRPEKMPLSFLKTMRMFMYPKCLVMIAFGQRSVMSLNHAF